MNPIARVFLTPELRSLILFHFGGLQHPLGSLVSGVLRPSRDMLARWRVYDEEMEFCSCRSCSYTPVGREVWAYTYMTWQATEYISVCLPRRKSIPLAVWQPHHPIGGARTSMPTPMPTPMPTLYCLYRKQQKDELPADKLRLLFKALSDAPLDCMPAFANCSCPWNVLCTC
jgi:hypothetical protein